MNNDVIVPFRIVPRDSAPVCHPDLLTKIDLLRDRALRGEIIGLAVATVTPEEGIGALWSCEGGCSSWAMVASLRRLSSDFENWALNGPIVPE